MTTPSRVQAPVADRVEPTRGVILISIDTLRADHLGCYGYARPTSPFIDSLAARGVLFENVMLQLPGTLPSHISMFRGPYPEEHSLYPPTDVLSLNIQTVPEAFRRAGFRTAGHTEGGYLNGRYGFAGGFDEFSANFEKVESDIERTFARGLRFLQSLRNNERFFLFLHSYTVHDPYLPTPRYLKRFWPGDVPPDAVLPAGPRQFSFGQEPLGLSPDALGFLRAQYDASIAYADDVLKDFFGELRGLGLADDLTVVLTSDHGEEFLEPGMSLQEQVYLETLRVPLIVLHPEFEAARIGRIVRSIDIAPTLYELAQVAAAPVSGESLVAQMAKKASEGTLRPSLSERDTQEFRSNARS